MKNISFIITCFVFPILLSAQIKPSIHGYTATTIDGNVINLNKYHGKKIMLVNTASYCAYTQQFAKLEELYKAYKQFNFEILGFPSNNFGGQDPGSDSVIHNFCVTNYGVSFQMMSKIAISSGDTAKVYRWLQQKNLNGVKDTAVDWNFNKFLINECGEWVAHYSSTVIPTSSAIKNWILSPSCIVNTNTVSSVGLSERSGQEEFFTLLSPNPVQEELVLALNPVFGLPVKVEIFSAYGQKIATLFEGGASEDQLLHYNSTSLADGIYLLSIQQGNIKENKRIIICK